MPTKNDSASKIPPVAGITIVLIAVLLGSAVWLKKRGQRDIAAPAIVAPPSTPAVARAQPAPAPAQPPIIEAQERVFPLYAGSQSCRGCHAAQFADWEKSNHGLAERLPNEALDAPAFRPPQTFSHGTQTSTAAEKDGHFTVEALGFDGRRESYPVARVIGHDPLRQFLIERPGGRLQTLEASYDPHKREWFNVYGNEDRQPGEWGHWTGRGMNWNTMCATCHNTRLRKNYDERTDTYRTAMAEMSVGCESCHGPMKAHAEWRRAHPQTKEPDPTLTRLDRDQVFDTCGACHARRRELTGDPVPGDPFHQHHQLTTVDETDLYYADGKVRDELYEYGSFLSSKMHTAGLRCVDCHDPHRAKPKLPGNDLCQSCHAGGATAPGGTIPAPIIEPTAHSHHAPGSTGAQCVNCHMPQTMFMQRHKRHDHAFTIPDPLLTREHGIPNACNQCHTDKDTDWAITAADRWWGEKMQRPARERTRLIARARAGDRTAGPPLLTTLRTEPSPYWKASILRLLPAWAGDTQTGRAFLEYAQHGDPLVRTAAVQGLESLTGAGPAAPPEQTLTRKLQDPSRSVRIAAAWALRDTLDENTRPAAELHHALAHSADQPAGQLQRGAWALARRDIPAALAHFARAVEWDPRSAAIRHEYGIALSIAGRSRDALAQIQEATRLEPSHAEYHYKLGLAWNETGSLSQALRAFEKSVALDKKHARAWYNLALAQNATGDLPAAIATLLAGEAQQTGDPRLPYARATIHARLGQIPEARAACEAALALAPGMTEARQLLDTLR